MLDDGMLPEPDPSERGENEYEPPRIESVLTAEELTREVQYAGFATQVADAAF